jgi:6-phosphogluconolactonase
MSEPRLHVLDDPAAAIGDLVAAQAAAGGSIVLTGGASIGPAYTRAALLQPDWHKSTLWWGDERCVRPDDERSNYGLACRTLLDRLRRPPELHRIHGELDPAEAAGDYDVELEDTPLDLLLLSLGADGHVASLFPGSPQLRERGVRATWGPASLEPLVDRVTMTLPTLLSARRIVLLATGAAKAAVFARAFGGEVDPELPSSLLRTGEAPLEIYCDRAAAGEG